MYAKLLLHILMYTNGLPHILMYTNVLLHIILMYTNVLLHILLYSSFNKINLSFHYSIPVCLPLIYSIYSCTSPISQHHPLTNPAFLPPQSGVMRSVKVLTY